ncbi:hypothetical protein CD178_03210 (plasmid) [Komagataeibacter saccharivorans]|uniref:Uncharacterized protein n=1 Tax=Komagataeibacter saccharivorans TaxID=265959 RepID=A0A347WGG1_9PROT|nr:hypothetical protein CD178_03210 [Komagataeibacter saccharivorans]
MMPVLSMGPFQGGRYHPLLRFLYSYKCITFVMQSGGSHVRRDVPCR